MFEEMGFEGILRREENGEVEKRGWRIRAEPLKKLLLLLEGKWKGERKRREEVFGTVDRAMVGASVKPGCIISSQEQERETGAQLEITIPMTLFIYLFIKDLAVFLCNC